MSLYSIAFYRRLASRPPSHGFLYVAYLVLFLSLSALIAYRFQFFPMANQFVNWLGRELPQITVTQQGLKMERESPVLLSHPEWGSLLYVDVTQDFPKSEDLEKAMVVLTRTTVAYREPSSGKIQLQKIVPEAPQREWQDFAITGDRVILFWLRIQPYIASLAFFAFFFLAYVWKLLAALFYSLIGLLLNLGRKERLAYPYILNITFYTLTPVTLLQCLRWLVPPLQALPLNFAIGFLITAAYLAVAILASLPRESTV